MKNNHTQREDRPCGVEFPFDQNGNGIGVLRAINPYMVCLELLFGLVAYNMIRALNMQCAIKYKIHLRKISFTAGMTT
jgi:hypothetical protein